MAVLVEGKTYCIRYCSMTYVCLIIEYFAVLAKKLPQYSIFTKKDSVKYRYYDFLLLLKPKDDARANSNLFK